MRRETKISVLQIGPPMVSTQHAHVGMKNFRNEKVSSGRRPFRDLKNEIFERPNSASKNEITRSFYKDRPISNPAVKRENQNIKKKYPNEIGINQKQQIPGKNEETKKFCLLDDKSENYRRFYQENGLEFEEYLEKVFAKK